jgi:hypothetical protein
MLGSLKVTIMAPDLRIYRVVRCHCQGWRVAAMNIRIACHNNTSIILKYRDERSIAVP